MIPPTNIFVPFTVFWVYMSRSPDILLQLDLRLDWHSCKCRLIKNFVGSTEIWSRHITQLRSDVHCQWRKSNQPNHLKIHNIHFLNVPENFVSSTRWPVWLWVFWKSHLEVLSWTMTMMPGKYGVVIIMDSDLHLASCVPAPKSYKKVWWSMKIVDRLDNVWCWCEMV